MPRATITSRQLKNKDTGLDLFVPSFKEIKGLMSSTVNYQVVLVSNLVCFKTPSHKESDVVQYSIEKRWSEFEDLRAKVAEIFSGTALPMLNKKAIIVNEVVLRERRNNLDQLVKFIASVPRLAICAPVLMFLGVDALRAKKFSRGESLEGTTGPSLDDREGEETHAKSANESDNIFDEILEDQGDAGLFDKEEDNYGDQALFGAGGESAVQVSMFEDQDLKGELDEEDEKKFTAFVPDAILTKKVKVVEVEKEEEGDHSDLLEIEDNLDQLFNTVSGKKIQQKKGQEAESSSSSPSLSFSDVKEATAKPKISTKPSPPSKPKPAEKPSVPSKPKASSTEDSKHSSSGNSPFRPTPAPRSKSVPKTTLTEQSKNTNSGSLLQEAAVETRSGGPTGGSGIDSMAADDIMKYLEQNTLSVDDVDLFS